MCIKPFVLYETYFVFCPGPDLRPPQPRHGRGSGGAAGAAVVVVVVVVVGVRTGRPPRTPAGGPCWPACWPGPGPFWPTASTTTRSDGVLDSLDPRSAVNHSFTFTFTFRAFSRRFYPKLLTISTFVRRKRNNNKLNKGSFIVDSKICTRQIEVKYQALTIPRLIHSPYKTKIATVRCYTFPSTIFKCKDVQHTISA